MSVDRHFSNAKKAWTPEDMEILAEKYGIVSDETLSKMLGGRSPNSMRIAARRKLNISHSHNFLTARNVADELGIACSKTVAWWHKKGWLKGKRSTVHAGKNIRWMFQEEEVLDCLKLRPYLCDLATMPQSYYRSFVRDEFAMDPWYSCEQVAPLLGVKTDDAVQRYIKKGFLKADKRPGGPHQWRWVIRRSSIEKFLANDPRPSKEEICRANILGVIRKARRIRKLATRWLLVCPLCGKDVIVTARPRLFGPYIMKKFTELFTNGSCSHGDSVLLELN